MAASPGYGGIQQGGRPVQPGLSSSKCGSDPRQNIREQTDRPDRAQTVDWEVEEFDPGNTSENLGTTPKARRAAQAVRERTSPRLRVEDRTFKRGRFRPALGGGGAVAMGQTGKYNDTSPARIQVPDGDP